VWGKSRHWRNLKDVSKLIFLSFFLTAPPALFNFVVISVFGLMRGYLRNTQRFSTEFTFSVLAIAAPYTLIVFFSLISKLSIRAFSISSFLLNALAVAVLVWLMDGPKER